VSTNSQKTTKATKIRKNDVLQNFDKNRTFGIFVAVCVDCISGLHASLF
jgi:hypothetical protein